MQNRDVESGVGGGDRHVDDRTNRPHEQHPTGDHTRVIGPFTGIAHESEGHGGEQHRQHDAHQTKHTGRDGVKQLAEWTADTEPFGRAEQYGEHEQQEAQTVTTVGWVVFADAGDGAYAGAERARNSEQDLLPQRLRFEVKLGLDLGFAIMGRPVVFGFTGFGAVGGCCSCHIGSDSTSTGVHGW